MPPVGVKCPGCGSSNLVEDELYSQTQTVCADCGSVVSEGFLASDPLGGSDVSYRYTTQETKKPCPNLIKGLERVRAMCRVLRVNSEIEQSSQNYFSQAYNHKNFINVTLTKKDALAGCCVLISCRMYNWPIAMATIAYITDTDPDCLGRVYQDALKTLDVSVPALSVNDVMEAHCQEYQVTSEHVPEELAADTKELTKRTLELVELAADSWIVTGRKPVPVMMAATYLAWQSLKPTKLRQSMSLQKFCQISKVHNNATAIKRVSEIKEMLCKLGREIPWIKHDITPNIVVKFIDEILNNKFALLRSALKRFEDSLNIVPQQLESVEETVTSNTPVVRESTEPHLDTVETLETQQQASSSDDPSTWGKRVLFAPPCVVKPKKKKRKHCDQVECTGDEEILDSEICSYIRTPQEVQELELAQKLFLQNTDVT